MEINKRNRTELKEYFKINDKPTQEEFSDFIEASINQAEDGIAKVQGNPLSIQAEGERVGTQEVLDLYESFADDNPQWSVNLNPRVNSEEPASNQLGLNIKDATGQSRLFIKSGQGNVGIGTIEPSAKLTLEGQNTSPLLSVIDTTDQRDTIFEVSKKEGVAVKGMLQVEGELKATNISDNEELDNAATSHGKLATQKAVKTYVDTRMPKGVIVMWSGNISSIPIGWALCDGNQGTPNLSGRFIVGFEKDNPEYQIGNKGGKEQVTLTTGQLPAHSHTGTTDEKGEHSHNFTGAAKRGDGSGTGSSNDYYKPFARTTEASGKHRHGFNTNNTGNNQPHENRPPYFVLAYIMKL
ncbi:hypothetical protein [Aquimarina sp. SS2-1]|uniref:phage baseplate protein n=1 Tax=Aquimarina besae TaxID=3342247 RepID=UPI00366CA729